MTETHEQPPRRQNRRLINEEPIDSPVLDAIVDYADQESLSLYSACITLTEIVVDILSYASIAIDTTSKHPADDLTRDESASIRLYTMEWNRMTMKQVFILFSVRHSEWNIVINYDHGSNI